MIRVNDVRKSFSANLPDMMPSSNNNALNANSIDCKQLELFCFAKQEKYHQNELTSNKTSKYK